MIKQYESRKRAIKKWNENNKERANYLRYRATAKLYIRLAPIEDLEEIIKLAKEKLKELKNTTSND